MRILLTNDDGVTAPGLRAMCEALRKIGQVMVVAPDGERSSISQAITLNHPIYHKTVTLPHRIKAHAISGTPADCVKFALRVLADRKPDMIVSGINDGSNDGCSVFYSGTVGAAREGALAGIPSLAVSLDTRKPQRFLMAAAYAIKIIRWVQKNKLPMGTFLNINVPDLAPSEISGVIFAAQCRVPIHGEFLKRQGPFGRNYYWLTGRPPAGKKDQGTDTYLLQKKYVVVAPIHCDGTNHSFLNTLQDRNIK